MMQTQKHAIDSQRLAQLDQALEFQITQLKLVDEEQKVMRRIAAKLDMERSMVEETITQLRDEIAVIEGETT